MQGYDTVSREMTLAAMILLEVPEIEAMLQGEIRINTGEDYSIKTIIYAKVKTSKNNKTYW